MHSVTSMVPKRAVVKKENGMPVRSAATKQIIFHVVRPNRTLLCIQFWSFEIVY